MRRARLRRTSVPRGSACLYPRSRLHGKPYHKRKPAVKDKRVFLCLWHADLSRQAALRSLPQRGRSLRAIASTRHTPQAINCAVNPSWIPLRLASRLSAPSAVEPSAGCPRPCDGALNAPKPRTARGRLWIMRRGEGEEPRTADLRHRRPALDGAAAGTNGLQQRSREGG